MTAPNVMAHIPRTSSDQQYRLGASLTQASGDIWINTTHADGTRIVVREPIGWEGLTFLTPIDQAGSRDGGLVGPPSVAPRLLDVEGAAVASSPRLLRQLISRLRGKLGPRMQVVWDQYDPGTGRRYGMVCYATGDFTATPIPGNGGVAVPFSFTLVAANPPWKMSTGVALQSCTGLPVENVGGRDYGGIDANTITNPDFESDTVGWFDFGGVLSHSTGQAHSGTGSGLATPDGTSSTGVYGIDSASAPAVTVGTEYRWTVWLYSPNGWSGFRPVIRWLDSGGSEVSQTEGLDVTIEAGVWTRLLVTGTAPESAVSASPRVWQRNTPSAGDTFHLDDARFSEVNGKTYDWDYGGAPNPGGFILAENDGDIPAWPVFELTGPVDLPTVTNESTDQSFTLNQDIPAGVTVTIDSRTGIVEPSGYRLVGRPWSLQPGDNTIRWRGLSGTFNEDALLCVSWRHTSM